MTERYLIGQRKEERKRTIKETQKKAGFRKRGRDDRQPRQKRWSPDDWQEDQTTYERIMPLDEADRRREVEKLAFQYKQPPSEMIGSMGRVLEMTSNLCRVDVDGDVALYTLRGSLSLEETGFTHPLAVGDWVQVEMGAQTVIRVMPRQNVLARPDPFYRHLQHMIAANVDQLLITVSWRFPTLWLAMIDRYLIAAERNGIYPLICLNKVDLAENRLEVEQYQEVYTQLGYDMILTSVPTGEGLENLRAALIGKTTVLTGMSGVGKSSLLTALQPDFNLKTGEVSSWGEDGKHTTTQARMLPFADGYVIDTPGIRAFGLSELTAEDVIDYYPDLAVYAEDCHFPNCSHQHEPRCEVRAAIDNGEVPAWRYKSYITIVNQLSEDKN